MDRTSRAAQIGLRAKGLHHRWLASILVGIAVSGCGSHPVLDSPDYLRGRQAFESGDYRGATDRFTAAIRRIAEEDPTRVFYAAYAARGDCYLALARRTPVEHRERYLNAAADDYRKVVTQDVDVRLRALEGLSAAEELAGNSSVAIGLFVEIANVASPSDAPYYALAHRRLGWNLLERVPEFPIEPLSEESASTYAQALDHFTEALRAAPDDASCLLGKGACLFRLGHHRRAREFLERALERRNAQRVPDPRTHFYLALVLETIEGTHLEAAGHMAMALEADPQRRYQPLYRHLLERLPYYLNPGEPPFLEAILGILEYSGDDLERWEKTEQLFDHYLSSGTLAAGNAGREDGESDTVSETESPNGAQTETLEPRLTYLEKLAYFGRALSRSRTGKIDAAVTDLLHRRHEPDFFDRLDKTFPIATERAEWIYGRLSCLREIGDLPLIERLIARGVQGQTDPGSRYHFLIEGIVGEILLERWKELTGQQQPPGDDGSYRERYLLPARASLDRFLGRFPESIEARLRLGEIEEARGKLSQAIELYRQAAHRDPESVEVFAHLMRLHSSGSLGPRDQQAVWSQLKAFQGDEERFRGYLRDHRRKLRDEKALYCVGCGRKVKAGDVNCLFCGRENVARSE